MDRQNSWNRSVLLCGIVLFLLMLFVNEVSAEKKIYNGTGEYTMSDYESPNVAEQRALTKAMENVREQAGIFVESYTKMDNMSVSDDMVSMITIKSLRIIKQSQRKEVGNNGDVRVFVDITAELDSAEIEKVLKEKAEQNLIDEKIYRKLREEISKDEKETLELKNKINDLKKNQQLITDLQISLKAKEQKRGSYQKVYECFGVDLKKDERISKLKEAIALYPQNSLAYTKLAISHQVRDEYDEALKNSDMVLVLNKDNGLAYLIKGAAYYSKAAIYDIAYHSKPVKDVKAMEGEDYKKVNELIEKAKMDVEKNKKINEFAKKAVDNFSKAISYEIDDEKKLLALFGRGNSYHLLKDYGNALADYSENIKINSNLGIQDYSKYEVRGNVYAEMGEYKSALLDYNKSIQLNNKNAGLYVLRAELFNKNGNIDKAIDDYNIALKLGNVDNAELYASRAELLHKKGNIDEAIADCNAALKLGCKDKERMYNIRAFCYLRKGDYTRAKNDVESTLSINNNSGEAYYYRGIINFVMDNYDQAIRDCDKAVSLLKKNDELSSAYCNRGNAYFVKGNYDQAIRDYKKALELHSNPDAAKNLAVVSEKKRQRGY